MLINANSPNSNDLVGVLPVAKGGTNQSALGTSLQVLRTNVLATDTEWATIAGTGTVITTGVPSSGNLTKFSGATSITNADLTGDVTTSGTEATTITNNAVTLAKMATMATDSILGRATAGTGDPEVLTALPFAATGDVTRPADSNVNTIANDAVTYAKMQNVSATDKLLGRSTAGSGDVEEIACTAGARTMIAKIAPFGVYNQSVANEGGAGIFNADRYLAGSSIAIPNSSLQAGSRYHCVFNVTKTAAGTATPIINVRFGTAGTTADTSRGTFTFTAGTAATDEGVFDCYFTFRTVGSGTSAVLQGLVQLKHRSNGAGIAAQSSEPEIATSGGFDSTVASSIIGISVNGGTGAVWTVSLVQAELTNLI